MNIIETKTKIATLIDHVDHSTGGTFALYFKKGLLMITPTKNLPKDCAKIASITAFEIQCGLTPNAWENIALSVLKAWRQLS